MEFRNEAEFEEALIVKLTKDDNQWSRDVLSYKSEQELIDNWAEILFRNNNSTDCLNNCRLTSTEMQQIISQVGGETPFQINRRLNARYISIIRDNPKDSLHVGRRVDLFIFDKEQVAAGKSVYQIARQPQLPVSNELMSSRRGDLMLLINGMPLYHIELKNFPVKVTEACNQISKYQQHGVFTGFFALVQVFVAMTPDETLYFANPGRDRRFNSDFFFHWADFNNVPINKWQDVASFLLSIPMAHRLIGYGTVADGSDGLLKVMRSYQYYAAFKIYSTVAEKHEWDVAHQKGGYVFHTTGSGKTMTSFKCAQLIKALNKVDKIVFLMDRDELWKQTYQNYQNYSDCDDIEDTANTNSLLSKLENSTKSLVIVTSIQKMSNLTTEDSNHYAARIAKVQKKKLVFIVDEAHRSTFGVMLRNIKRTYPNAVFFGFTGTPIMDVNAIEGITTEGLFGSPLHNYRINEGIRDKNVLGFKPFRLLTFDEQDLREKFALIHLNAASVEALDDEMFQKYQELLSRDMSEVEKDIPESFYSKGETGAAHRQKVVEDILRQWQNISYRGKFHYILATSSIREAIEYYRLLRDNPLGLFATAVFDPHTDNTSDDIYKDLAVIEILKDYNSHFNTHFRAGSYRRFKDDVCARLSHSDPYKDLDSHREDAVNIVIVVNQLLTGFDSSWLNTIYLDKVLAYEQFIQAVSRTNRLHGYEKQYGILKYCRKPFTMEKNALAALKLYTEIGYDEVFVPSLGEYIISINNSFLRIRELFEKDGISDFSRLPSSDMDIALFVDLFNNLSNAYLRAIPQLFSWNQTEYDTEDAGHVTLLLDEWTYETLKMRYAEVPPPPPPGSDHVIYYDIKAYLTGTSLDEINKQFLESKFRQIVKDLSNGASHEDIAALLQELRSKFAVLPADDQVVAETILGRIISGDLDAFSEGKSLEDYISLYKYDELREHVRLFSSAFGFNYDRLLRVMGLNLTEDNIMQGGHIDAIMKDLDYDRALRVVEETEGHSVRPYMIFQIAQEYLVDFILSGGKIDPYKFTSL